MFQATAFAPTNSGGGDLKDGTYELVAQTYFTNDGPPGPSGGLERETYTFAGDEVSAMWSAAPSFGGTGLSGSLQLQGASLVVSWTCPTNMEMVPLNYTASGDDLRWWWHNGPSTTVESVYRRVP